MTLAPIRGAPPGASVPDFPAEGQRVGPAPASAMPVSGDQRQLPRRPYTPAAIAGGGIVLTLRVIPEQPAISRASMVVQVVADPVGPSQSETIGLLRMSANGARTFLAALRDGRFPIVATGDEGGTVQIEYESTEGGRVFSVRDLGERHVLCRLRIDGNFDMKAMAGELLVDLGA